MTENETGYAPPPPGFTPPPPTMPAPPRPALRRTTGNDKVLGGVAAGIARSLGIDPILVRVAFVVLAIFGGSGLLLYLAGWLFIPDDGHADSMGERFFRNNGALGIAAAVVVGVLVVAPMLAWSFWADGPGFGGVVLLFLVVAAVVALTRRGDRATSATEPAPAGQAATPVVPDTTSQSPTVALATTPPGGPGSPTVALPTAPPPPPPPAPKPPREKSVLGRLTIGILLLVSGSLIALDVANVMDINAVVVIATALAIVATGLLVGAFVGRSRGLIALGVVLVLVLIPLAAIPNDVRWNAGSGAGERVYRVTSPEDLQPTYELGVGQLTLDLRKLDPTAPLQIDASVGIGELRVLLPEDTPTSATADVAVGTIVMPGERSLDGVDIARTWGNTLDTGYSAGTLDLTLSTGLGQITVIDYTPEVVR